MVNKITDSCERKIVPCFSDGQRESIGEEMEGEEEEEPESVEDSGSQG